MKFYTLQDDYDCCSLESFLLSCLYFPLHVSGEYTSWRLRLQAFCLDYKNCQVDTRQVVDLLRSPTFWNTFMAEIIYLCDD